MHCWPGICLRVVVYIGAISIIIGMSVTIVVVRMHRVVIPGIPVGWNHTITIGIIDAVIEISKWIVSISVVSVIIVWIKRKVIIISITH